MSNGSDGAVNRLANVDPVLLDPPPAPGSVRHDLIMEEVMRTIERRPVAVHRPKHRSRRRPAFVTAVALTVAVGLFVAQPWQQSPTAALAAAAANTAAIDSYRYELVRADQGPGSNHTREIASAELNGHDFTSDVAVQRVSDGAMLFGESVIKVGDTMWTRLWDNRHSGPPGNAEFIETVDPVLTVPSITEASAALVEAVLGTGTVEDLGRESVRGVIAHRYRIELGEAEIEALASLPEGLFELHYIRAGGSPTLDIWVTGSGLITRLVLDSSESIRTVEIYDFSADIEITPPAGS